VTRPDLVDAAALDEWLGAHHDWQLRDGHLVREVEPAERLDHHPVVNVGYCQLRFELWTHDRDGVTQLDLDYAGVLEDVISTRFAAFVLAT
jgi:hypothetical protein